MNRKYSFFSLLLVVLLWTGCAGSQSVSEQPEAPAQEQPINVLVVTATHGFRHEPAIARAKEVLPAIADTTEFAFTFTENLDDLNPQNLARYDVLFFANATLRGEPEESEAGTIATWNFTMETGQAAMPGVIAISGEPGAYTGTIKIGTYPEAPLKDITLDEQRLSFAFDAGDYGTITGEADLTGDELSGALTMRGNPMAISGTRATAAGGGEGKVAAPVSDAQKQAIQAFLQAGKGIAVAHAGLDAFYDWPWYREMVGGGLFEEHPWTQEVGITIEDKDSPATRHFGDGFRIHDEIYVLDENPRWNSHVLASLDMESVGIEQGPADFTRNDYPISWIRKQDGGRVFVTKLGHFPEVWSMPAFQTHILQGMRMAAGRIPANFSGYRVKEVLAENVWPDDIAVDERGNVWIAELRGKVHLYDNATGQTRQIAHLNTTDPTKIEHGLYGIEVDPNFYDGEPYVYVFYAEPETFINTLWRYEFRNGQLDLSTGQRLLNVPTEPQCCHQAGDLEWGPDGTLYLSTGDTGMSETRPAWENTEEDIQAFMDRYDLENYHWSRLVDSERSAQNLTDLRGKILRINKDGSIPKDNPFFGKPGVRWEIYAYGLRNPYRFKVDPETGHVHIGVVGPDEVVTYDEYNVSTKGGENFGWPRDNGRLLYNEWKPEMIPDYAPSTWEYTYETGGRSATVGPIYRSDGPYAFPEAFQNKVFIYDWARRWIKWADVEDRTWTNDTTGSVKAYPYSVSIPAKRYTNIKTFDQLTETAPISMELAPDGSLILAEFDGFWDAGPKAKVTRYRWVTDDAPAPTSATAKAKADSRSE